MTHCCKNGSISRIKSIILVNERDLEHCAAWAVLPSIWKQRYYFMGGGSFWSGLWVLFLCWHCSESDPNKIWALGTVTLWFFWDFQRTIHLHHPKNLGTWCSCTVIVYSGGLKWLSIIITQQNLGRFCSETVFFFSGSFKRLSIVININISNQHVFCVWIKVCFELRHQVYRIEQILY